MLQYNVCPFLKKNVGIVTEYPILVYVDNVGAIILEITFIC